MERSFMLVCVLLTLLALAKPALSLPYSVDVVVSTGTNTQPRLRGTINRNSNGVSVFTDSQWGSFSLPNDFETHWWRLVEKSAFEIRHRGVIVGGKFQKFTRVQLSPNQKRVQSVMGEFWFKIYNETTNTFDVETVEIPVIAVTRDGRSCLPLAIPFHDTNAEFALFGNQIFPILNLSEYAGRGVWIKTHEHSAVEVWVPFDSLARYDGDEKPERLSILSADQSDVLAEANIIQYRMSSRVVNLVTSASHFRARSYLGQSLTCLRPVLGLTHFILYP